MEGVVCGGGEGRAAGGGRGVERRGGEGSVVGVWGPVRWLIALGGGGGGKAAAPDLGPSSYLGNPLAVGLLVDHLAQRLFRHTPDAPPPRHSARHRAVHARVGRRRAGRVGAGVRRGGVGGGRGVAASAAAALAAAGAVATAGGASGEGAASCGGRVGATCFISCSTRPSSLRRGPGRSRRQMAREHAETTARPVHRGFSTGSRGWGASRFGLARGTRREEGRQIAVWGRPVGLSLFQNTEVYRRDVGSRWCV
jgi:hypothetical protein